MIRYALRCECGHAFESWFQSSAAFDSQVKRKLVTCPSCDSAHVEKAIMAPRLAGTKKKRSSASAEAAGAPTPLVMAPQERAIMEKLRELRDHVAKTAEDVGEKFPDKARAMHYGDIEQRPIYGQASTDEARALIEEGVDVLPLPVLPDDRN